MDWRICFLKGWYYFYYWDMQTCLLNVCHQLQSFSSLVDSNNNNRSLCWILFVYIPGYSWQWLPATLWLLLYVHFKALFQRGASSENSLYSNDSLISCFLAFVVFTTEMWVQILIKRWASLYCLLPLTVPLDWTPANQAIYFPLPSFSFPAKINSKIFWFAVTKACWFLS